MKSRFFSQGLRFALRNLGKHSLNPLRLIHRGVWWTGRALLGPRSFEVDGESISYFLHPLVINTERVVEISLGRRFVAQQDPSSVLEIGNVLAVFSKVRHRVVDKYEPGQGVENLDIVDFQPQTLFQRILCLSTLEHVGIDEEPRDEHKALVALERIPKWLAEDGEALVTIPLGHHPRLDELLTGADRRMEQELGWKLTFLQRQNKWNTWEQIPGEEARGARYGSPFACANVVAILRRTARGHQP